MVLLLQEDIAAVKKYYPNIPEDTFMELIALDPTYTGKDSVGKYGKWLLNLFNRGKITENDFDEIPDLLNQFTTYKNRIQNKDLNSYKTLDELAETLASVIDDMSMLTPSQRTKFLKRVKSGKIKVDKSEDYDIVLNTPNFIVYVPNTHEASMKLGKDTDWCTAHEDPKWYNDYTKNGKKLYIIKDKKTGERWQYSDKKGDFLDPNDKEFDILWLMRRDEKLSKFFAKLLGVDLYNFDGTWVYDGKKIPDKLKQEIVKVIITDNVTNIGDDAFSRCESLTSITIPDSVTSIGDAVFRECTSLTSIIIPDSVTSIGDGAFKFCSSLKNIIIPDSIRRIGGYAFWNCISLRSITIPDSITRIGYCTFGYCENLTDITIPDSVTSIDDYAFEECNNLTVYTNNEYIIDYCEDNDIPVESLRYKNESSKLRIREYHIYYKGENRNGRND